MITILEKAKGGKGRPEKTGRARRATKRFLKEKSRFDASR